VPKERIAMLRECVEIVKSMWSEKETTYHGTYYRLDRGNCDPKPVQKPRPPIWIGGGGEQLTLRVVARHADYANFGGTIDDFKRKKQILADHCQSVGRDFDEIQLTWSPEIFIRESEKEVAAAGSRSLWGAPFEQWQSVSLVGTPEQVSEKIAAYRALGCVGFVPWCADYPQTSTLDLFAKIAADFR
jgi:alkanesulfonate monooxygenase SsuD/methylene tetrahydromethanopterin reductase-like flavin-dependent oxidoreductase (luciferase family)